MELPFSQACENNKAPILGVLNNAFAHSQSVLELGCGTAQHAVYFARRLPHLRWQASDQTEYLPGAAARIQQEGSEQQPLPVEFNVFQTPPAGSFDALFSANTCHIMPTQGVEALFQHLGNDLSDVKTLCLYGPFNDAGTFTSDSNRAFHASLQARDSAMGIRDWQWIVELAEQQQFQLKERHRLPANNDLLEFYR